MWRNWNPCVLGGHENGAGIMGITMESPQKIKNTTTI